MTTAVYLCPTFGVGYQAFSSGGLPGNGFLIYTYIAGGTTPQATYVDSGGVTQNANPIVCAADGRIGEVWLLAGQSYRIDVKDSLGNLIRTYDNIQGINDPSLSQSEWKLGPTPTFVSATSFTLVGDQTTTFHVGRRVKGAVTAGLSYGTITASAFGAVTTVTVDTTGSNPIDSGLSAVSYGLLSAANFSQSAGLDAITRQGANIVSAATTNLNAAGGDYVHITGATGITAITLAQGHERTVVFDGVLIITNGASLILPGGANITTAAGDTAIFNGEAAGVVRCIAYTKASGVPVTLSQITNSLSGDVALNNTGLFFVGPTVAQGTVGTWFASGSVTVTDTAGVAQFIAKLWDGTTVINSTLVITSLANRPMCISLSGILSSPAGNIRISVKDSSSASGAIVFNNSGESKDSTLTAMRIA